MSGVVPKKLSEKGISYDKLQEYLAAFRLFDTNNTGKITAASIGRALNDNFRQSYSNEDLAYMLRQFAGPDATAGVTEVDFETFALSLHEKMNDSAYTEAYGDAFDLFDTSKSGELNEADIMEGFQKLGENLTKAEAAELLKVASKRDDFVRYMSNAARGGMGTTGSAPAGAPAPVATGPAGM